MKNKRTAIVAFLLVAVLCLGVGFAALSDDLFIDGTLAWSHDKANEDFDMDVHFADPTVADDSTCAKVASIATTLGNDDTGAPRGVDDKLTITVGDDAFSTAGQVATITVKVVNDSTDSVTVSVNDANKTTTTSGLFEIEVTAPTGEIAANGCAEVTITITLKATSETDVTGDTFSFELTAESVH